MKRLVIALSSALVVLPIVAAVRPAPLRANRPDLPPPGQLPIMVPPPTNDQPPAQSGPTGDDGPAVQPAVRLADMMGSNRAVSSFSSLTRKHASTETRLDNPGVNTTVLAPLNSAMDNLPHKPWEDPREIAAYGAQAYDGSGGQDRADNNLRKFVEAHLVSASPWEADTKAKTVGGRDIWWEEKDGKRIIMPDNIEVDRVAGRVSNGEIVGSASLRSQVFKARTDSQL